MLALTVRVAWRWTARSPLSAVTPHLSPYHFLPCHYFGNKSNRAIKNSHIQDKHNPGLTQRLVYLVHTNGDRHDFGDRPATVRMMVVCISQGKRLHRFTQHNYSTVNSYLHQQRSVLGNAIHTLHMFFGFKWRAVSRLPWVHYFRTR